MSAAAVPDTGSGKKKRAIFFFKMKRAFILTKILFVGSVKKEWAKNITKVLEKIS